MSSHRKRVQSRTRTWQFGALALAAGAAAIGIMPLARQLGPKPLAARTSTNPDAATLPPTGTPMPAEATTALAGWMNGIAGKVAIPEPVEPLTTEPTDTEVAGGEPAPPPTPVSETQWVYKSYMGSPTLKGAVVTVGDHQVLMFEGGEYDNRKVLEIKPDHMRVKTAEVEERIDLSARIASGWPSDGPRRPIAARPGMPNIAPNGQPGVPGQPNASFSMAVNNAANAAAIAEQQRRARMAMSPPPVASVAGADDGSGEMQGNVDPAQLKEAFTNMPDEQREELRKMLGDPTMDGGKKLQILHDAGLPLEANEQDRIQFMDYFGITPQSDANTIGSINKAASAPMEKRQ